MSEINFVEITRPGHRRDRPYLVRLEVPALKLVFHRPSFKYGEILVYCNGVRVSESTLPDSGAQAFRDAARTYVEKYFPGELQTAAT